MEGCEFRTRRTRLKAHYINTHKMEDPEAENLVPARLISTSDTQRMNCPLCEHRCLPIMLRKHLFRAHSKDLNLEEINTVFEEAIKCKASTKKAQALAAAVVAGLPLPADGVIEVAEDGIITKIFVHPENLMIYVKNVSPEFDTDLSMEDAIITERGDVFENILDCANVDGVLNEIEAVTVPEKTLEIILDDPNAKIFGE